MKTQGRTKLAALCILILALAFTLSPIAQAVLPQATAVKVVVDGKTIGAFYRGDHIQPGDIVGRPPGYWAEGQPVAAGVFHRVLAINQNPFAEYGSYEPYDLVAGRQGWTYRFADVAQPTFVFASTNSDEVLKMPSIGNLGTQYTAKANEANELRRAGKYTAVIDLNKPLAYDWRSPFRLTLEGWSLDARTGKTTIMVGPPAMEFPRPTVILHGLPAKKAA